MAKEIALQLNADPEIIFEGQEKKHFWDAIGGKQAYFDEKVLKQSENVLPPRLFQISNATGNIRVEEFAEFGQDDLVEEDVMLLDASHTIFIWLGAMSNRQEQQEGVRIGRDYLETCPNERDGDTPIMIIKQGLEPTNFTGHFGVWDEARWNVEQMYAEAAARQELAEPQLVTEGFTLGYTAGTLPYSVLVGGDLPDTVDPAKKEEYLSDAEFVEVLGLKKEEFSCLPAWKQVNLKKNASLF